MKFNYDIDDSGNLVKSGDSIIGTKDISSGKTKKKITQYNSGESMETHGPADKFVHTNFDPNKGEVNIQTAKWNKKKETYDRGETAYPTHTMKESNKALPKKSFSSDDITVARLLKGKSPEEAQEILESLGIVKAISSAYTTSGALSSKRSGGPEGVKLLGEIDKHKTGKPSDLDPDKKPTTGVSGKPSSGSAVYSPKELINRKVNPKGLEGLKRLSGSTIKSVSDTCDEILSKEKRVSYDSNSKFTYDTEKEVGEGSYQYSDKDNSDGGKAHTHTNRATPTSKGTTHSKKYDYDPKRQEVSSYHTNKPGAKKVIDTTKEYEEDLKNASISDICDDIMEKAKGTKPKDRSLLEGPYAEEAHKRYEARKPAVEAHAAKTKSNLEATGRAVAHFRSKADEGFGEQESEEKSYSLDFNKSILEKMGLEKGRKSAWESKGQKEDTDVRVPHSSDSSAGNLNPHTESRMQGIRERGEHDNLKRMASSKDPSDIAYAKKKGYSLD